MPTDTQKTTTLAQTYEQLVSGLQEYGKKHNFSRAVIGVSGGIDSALTLKIAVDALGPKNVTALLMPEKGVSSEENIFHARTLCDFFGVKYHVVPINRFIIEFGMLPWKSGGIAAMNLKARTRMLILYHYANTSGALVLGTSNKSEILLGYGTKFGDFAADVEVIGELYKEDVYALSEYVGMPDELMTKRPTAELAPGQTDEDELGATYGELDPILKQHELGFERLLEKGINPALLNRVFRRIEENRHKTAPAPILKITRSE